MLHNLAAGEHLLLMGNQGVGKNKLIDHLLMLLHRERHLDLAFLCCTDGEANTSSCIATPRWGRSPWCLA